MQASLTALPESLRQFAGAILDVDSHEHTPINHWVERFGKIAAPMVEAISNTGFMANVIQEADDTEISDSTVWNSKWAAAPGSYDLRRRYDVMDYTGVRRQLMYPGGLGHQTVILHSLADKPNHLPEITGDRVGYAREMISAYNEWCAEATRLNDRLRPVAVVIADTVDGLFDEVRKWIGKGIRAIWFPSATLPGGVSPAHSALDPIYRQIASADVALVSHVGAELGFLKTDAWSKAPAFQGFRKGGELSLDPWSLCAMGRATENFLCTMVLGGVFERHPTLRFGTAEVGAEWIGPLAYRMDMWLENSGVFKLQKSDAISLKPSEYIRRNVRVSPFDFEDVGLYIKQFGLEEVYCYASDYPHAEGGKDPMGRFAESFARHGLGDEHLRRFFVENGGLLLPD